jgi:hypothetical protein
MKYSTPELVIVGSASALVQGVYGMTGDNVNEDFEHLAEGCVAGLDD